MPGRTRAKIKNTKKGRSIIRETLRREVDISPQVKFINDIITKNRATLKAKGETIGRILYKDGTVILFGKSGNPLGTVKTGNIETLSEILKQKEIGSGEIGVEGDVTLKGVKGPLKVAPLITLRTEKPKAAAKKYMSPQEKAIQKQIQSGRSFLQDLVNRDKIKVTQLYGVLSKLQAAAGKGASLGEQLKILNTETRKLCKEAGVKIKKPGRKIVEPVTPGMMSPQAAFIYKKLAKGVKGDAKKAIQKAWVEKGAPLTRSDLQQIEQQMLESKGLREPAAESEAVTPEKKPKKAKKPSAPAPREAAPAAPPSEKSYQQRYMEYFVYPKYTKKKETKKKK